MLAGGLGLPDMQPGQDEAARALDLRKLQAPQATAENEELWKLHAPALAADPPFTSLREANPTELLQARARERSARSVLGSATRARLKRAPPHGADPRATALAGAPLPAEGVPRLQVERRRRHRGHWRVQHRARNGRRGAPAESSRRQIDARLKNSPSAGSSALTAAHASRAVARQASVRVESTPKRRPPRGPESSPLGRLLRPHSRAQAARALAATHVRICRRGRSEEGASAQSRVAVPRPSPAAQSKPPPAFPPLQSASMKLGGELPSRDASSPTQRASSLLSPSEPFRKEPFLKMEASQAWTRLDTPGTSSTQSIEERGVGT